MLLVSSGFSLFITFVKLSRTDPGSGQVIRTHVQDLGFLPQGGLIYYVGGLIAECSLPLLFGMAVFRFEEC